MDSLNWLWLRFGKSAKSGATNFTAILGAISVAISLAVARGKLSQEAKDWVDILLPIAVTIAGLSGGRSSDLKTLQQEIQPEDEMIPKE
jgi:hypothetical protein